MRNDPPSLPNGLPKDRVRSLERCVGLAMSGVEREFPTVFPVLWSGAESLKTPRDFFPIFYGCLDWHSAVHSHWLLLRVLRFLPEMPRAQEAVDYLTRVFIAENFRKEAEFFQGPQAQGFERPYGYAWLLQLAAELHELVHDEQRPKILDGFVNQWREAIRPLEEMLLKNWMNWLPRQQFAVLTGEHNQTSFALGLLHDYGTIVGRPDTVSIVNQTAAHWHQNDIPLPVEREPNAFDFLSPAVATADLMRRVIPSADQYAAWLDRTLPAWTQWPESIAQWPPVSSVDRKDGKLAHLDGLAFSRAWMMEGIAAALPEHDPRRMPFLAGSEIQGTSGMPGLQSDEYMTTHWLGSFAVYWMTQRGINQNRSGAIDDILV